MTYQFDVNLFEKQLMTLNPAFHYHEFAICIFKSYNLNYYNTNEFLNALLQDKKNIQKSHIILNLPVYIFFFFH